MFQISLSPGKDYREGHEFVRTKAVLGSGNCAGDIIVVKDMKKGTEHAQKTVSGFSYFSNYFMYYVIDLLVLDSSKLTAPDEKE